MFYSFYNKTKRSETYHLNKSKICLENDVKLIHIFDFEVENLNLSYLINKYLSNEIEIIGNKKIYVSHKDLKELTEPDKYGLYVYKPIIQFNGLDEEQ